MADNTVDFDTLLARLKMYLLREQGKVKGKIYDKEVAQKLGIGQREFISMKQRGKVPFKQVLDYCYHSGIDINRIFSK